MDVSYNRLTRTGRCGFTDLGFKSTSISNFLVMKGRRLMKSTKLGMLVALTCPSSLKMALADMLSDSGIPVGVGITRELQRTENALCVLMVIPSRRELIS